MPEAALKWKFLTNGHIESTPYIDDKMIFFGSNDGYFYALDIENGDLAWKKKLNVNICSTPTVIGSTVCVGSDDNQVIAFNKESGEELWVFETDGEIDTVVNRLEDKIIFGAWDGVVYCVDGKSGEKVWDFHTNNVISCQVYADNNNNVYISGGDLYLYSVDKDNADIKWKYKVDSEGLSRAIIYEENLYIGSWAGTLHAIDPETGKGKWVFHADDKQVTTPVFKDNYAFFGSNGGLFYALNLNDQTKKWQFQTGEQKMLIFFPTYFNVTPGVILDERFVIFGSRDNNLYALNLATGDQAWKFQTYGSIESTPVAKNDIIYCGSNDGCMYAIVNQEITQDF